MINKHIHNLLLTFIIFTSCDQANLYDENKPIDNRTWNYSNPVKFQVDINDSKAKYDIYVRIRHTPEYKYSNLFFLLHQTGNKLKDTAYRHEVKLAELDGRWLGNSAGSLFNTEFKAEENFIFPDTGIYSFTVEQNMRDNPLKNISDVGLKIIKK